MEYDELRLRGFLIWASALTKSFNQHRNQHLMYQYMKSTHRTTMQFFFYSSLGKYSSILPTILLDICFVIPIYMEINPVIFTHTQIFMKGEDHIKIHHKFTFV